MYFISSFSWLLYWNFGRSWDHRRFHLGLWFELRNFGNFIWLFLVRWKPEGVVIIFLPILFRTLLPRRWFSDCWGSMCQWFWSKILSIQRLWLFDISLYMESIVNRLYSWSRSLRCSHFNFVRLNGFITSRVKNRNFILIPMPNIIKESPYYLSVALDDQVLCPEISRTEPWEVFQVIKYFFKVRIDSWDVLGVTVDAFYYRWPSLQSI